MSRHRQNLQVARRPPGQEFRGEPSNGGFGSFNDHRNARYGGGRYEEALGLGNRGRLDDRGRSLGRLAGRLGGLGLGGRRGEGIGGFNSMGGGFMGSPGMYERPSAYSLQSQMQMGRGPLGGDGYLGRQQDPYLARRFDLGMGDPRGLGPARQSDLESILPGRPQGLGGSDSRRQSMQAPTDAIQYSFDRLDCLDRQPRLYHYRPPYVEDDLTEDYLREQDLMDMEQLGMHPDDYYGPFFDDEDSDSFQGALRR